MGLLGLRMVIGIVRQYGRLTRHEGVKLTQTLRFSRTIVLLSALLRRADLEAAARHIRGGVRYGYTLVRYMDPCVSIPLWLAKGLCEQSMQATLPPSGTALASQPQTLAVPQIAST